MLISDRPRSVYDNAPVHEVICQLRFPAILSISSTEPADFQETIREDFPRYAKRQDAPPPQIVGLGGPNPEVRQQPPVTNHNFFSADGLWKLNLTHGFIALSTLHYTGWEEFAHVLDKPLATFISMYKPAYFERVGLRYVNVISRQRLGLEGTPWVELIAPAYVGALLEPDVEEENVTACSTELALKLSSSCYAKIHAGPGRIKNSNSQEPPDMETKFVIDMDLAMGGQLACTLSAGALETLHAHATSLFEGAITETLRNAIS